MTNKLLVSKRMNQMGKKQTRRTPKAFAMPARVASECKGPIPPYTKTWNKNSISSIMKYKAHKREESIQMPFWYSHPTLIVFKINNCYHVIYRFLSFNNVCNRIYLHFKKKQDHTMLATILFII